MHKEMSKYARQRLPRRPSEWQRWMLCGELGGMLEGPEQEEGSLGEGRGDGGGNSSQRGINTGEAVSV